MYVIERGKSAWLCTSAIEAFEVHAVQIRLQGDMKQFAKFQQSLDNFERVDARVISVYKCSEAGKCEDCKRCIGCEILQKVQETAQAHVDFAKWVDANGGYLIK